MKSDQAKSTQVRFVQLYSHQGTPQLQRGIVSQIPVNQAPTSE